MALSKGWIIGISIGIILIGWWLSDPAPPPSPLLKAAFKGDLYQIRELLPLQSPSQPKNESHTAHLRRLVNVRDGWNNTALHWAAKGGSALTIDIVKHLLLAGANVTAINSGGSNVLHWSSTLANGKLSRELIQLFYSKGVAINDVNRALEAPLHWAVDWGRLESVDALLDLGANANLKDIEGNTPLHKIKLDCHESEECTAIVTRLLKGGADASMKNNFNRLPLQYFNQDKEQQVRQQNEKRQGQGQQSTSTTTDSSTPSPSSPITPDQIEAIQKQFAEFKKNMTEGALDEERVAPSEQRN